MKKIILVIAIVSQLTGCISAKSQKLKTHNISGIYTNQISREKLELKDDGTYIIWNDTIYDYVVIEQCDYFSKGIWSIVADNLLEITSEDYYTKQKGYEYEIIMENKFSQDSLYINVLFPTEFHPVNLRFSFNYDTSKSIETEKNYIVLPKSKHLRGRPDTTNQIGLSLYAKISGTKFYNSRTMFEIFEGAEERINTEKFNYLTIVLKNFDRCFFEFVPYNHDFIYIKNNNLLLWKNEVWRKTNIE